MMIFICFNEKKLGDLAFLISPNASNTKTSDLRFNFSRLVMVVLIIRHIPKQKIEENDAKS